MLRQCLAVLVGLGLTSAAPAATWAEGLFEELSHDFGPTPRGPVLIHHYRLTNNTQATVHVSNVRVSCGCTQATVMHGTLEPGKAPGKASKLDEKAKELLVRDLEERPWATHFQRVEFLAAVAGVKVSEATLCRTIKRLSCTRKKEPEGQQKETSS